jgi:CheY-like chemotaxis protein
MANPAKSRVWMVDDLQANRDAFTERHSAEFDVRTFEGPDQLLDALATETPPDALVCDIFYYQDAAKGEEAERRVAEEAKRLRSLAEELDADRAAQGIGMIERVRRRFRDAPPFPIYAYTTKGAYLFPDASFDRLERLQARWLPKNKCSIETERARIRRDIEEFRERTRHLPKRVSALVWRAAIAGALLGIIFDRLVGAAGI